MKKMNLFKKIIMVATLCGTVILTGCNKENKEASGDIEYKVAIKDAFGNPYTSGIIAEFYSGSEKVGMQVCNEEGIVKKTLAAGDYTVSLAFTDGIEKYHYEKEGLMVSADKNEIAVVVAHAVTEAGPSVYVEPDNYETKIIGAGCTYTTLTAGDMNYYLFTPTEAGMYELSVVEGENVSIGYYGIPDFVQKNSIVEPVDNKILVSIKSEMIGTNGTGTSVMVIGIKAEENAKDCVIGVRRTGEPEHTIEDEPWTVYEAKTTPVKYTMPEGVVLKDFDLTADNYELVLNEGDGYYHLNTADGPLVYMSLVEDNSYIPSYKTMLETSDAVKYFYDENGEFIKKEGYSKCLKQYIECADEETGMYPLTEDLKYIVQQSGDNSGWWDLDGQTSIFKDDNGMALPGINEDIAWLFMCCYAE